MEYLNKVELVGITSDHYREAEISNGVIAFRFQLRLQNSYTSLSGAQVVTTSWIPIYIVSHPSGNLRDFIFRPRTPIRLTGRLQLEDRFVNGESRDGFSVNVSEAEYLEETKEEEGAK